MKKIFISLLLILPVLSLVGCQENNQDNNQNNIEISRTGVFNNTNTENNLDNNPETKPQNNTETKKDNNKPVETVLCEFSTPIKSRSSNRLNNIKITCSSLNETTVNNGEEFSFCSTVGRVSKSKGYKEADVIVNKKVRQALGGGMCQVSTTLYNAVLGVEKLNVTERHPHDKPVNYVAKGKDATVSYGSLDFKFVNNTGKNIKIYSSADNGTVYVKIVSLS